MTVVSLAISPQELPKSLPPIAANENRSTDDYVQNLESVYHTCFDAVWAQVKREQVTDESVKLLQLAQALLINSPNGKEVQKFQHLVRLAACSVPTEDIPRDVYKDFADGLAPHVGPDFARNIHLELFRRRVSNFLGARKDLA